MDSVKVGFFPAFSKNLMLFCGFTAIFTAAAFLLMYHPATLVAQSVQFSIALSLLFQGWRWIGDYVVGMAMLFFLFVSVVMAVGVFLSGVPAF